MRAELIPIDSIVVDEERQRKDKSIDDLLPSIQKRGVITPIIVTQTVSEILLIAGERRLLCAKRLGHKVIPARFLEQMPSIERQIIELEENLHRKDLDWKDFCLSVKQVHSLYTSLDPKWTQDQTGASINITGASISRILRVATEVAAENKKILACPGWTNAFNIIARLDARRADNAFNELMEEPHHAGQSESEPISSPSSDNSAPEPQAKPQPFSPNSDCHNIITDSFISWASCYQGPLFNFIHCDFPYGIGLDRSDQGNSARWGSYSDREGDYWTLCKTLVDNYERLFAPSSHLMFWLSADVLTIMTTVDFLTETTDLKFNPKPLIWYKSDNRGILPDPKRGPRHVYETAIFASRGDRLINQSVSDCYASPAGEKSHQSEKSEPMLRHFFRMFIDEGTRFLDGTCGTGSSIRAAESLGATATGIEINEDWGQHGRELLRKSRILRHYNAVKEEKRHEHKG